MKQTTSWNSIFSALEKNEPFRIDMQEIFFCIPIGIANEHLSEAISSSKWLKIITIQEDDFDERDWQILTAGIINYKKLDPEKYHFQLCCSRISKQNIKYINDIIERSQVRQIRFQDITFEDPSIFESFCGALQRNGPRLLRVEISTNSLTNDQIEQLTTVLRDANIPIVNLQKFQISIASSIDDIANLTLNQRIFTIENMTALKIKNGPCSGIGLLNKAISLSTSLKKIIIKPDKCSFSDLKYLVKPIAMNGSIRTLQFHFNSYMNQNEIKKFLEIIPHIYNTDRTRNSIQFNIDGPYPLSLFVFTTLGEMLNNCHSLNHVDCHVRSDMHDIADTLIKATNLTSLTVDASQRFDTANIARLVRGNTNLSKLSFTGEGEINTNFEIEKLMELFKIETLTELNLNARNMSRTACEQIEAAIYNNETIKSFSIYFNFHRFLSFDNQQSNNDFFHEILLRNNTITALDATQIFFRNSEHYQMFFEGLAQNRTLRSLSWNFSSNKFQFQQITTGLARNSTLTQLHLFVGSYSTEILFSDSMVELFRASDSVKKIIFTIVDSTKEMLLETLWTHCRIALWENKALTEVLAFSLAKEQLPSDPKVEQLLQRNKEQQQDNTMNTTLFIKHIASKPDVYLSLLPLEVWSNIFKYVKYPGIQIDFSELVMNYCGQ